MRTTTRSRCRKNSPGTLLRERLVGVHYVRDVAGAGGMSSRICSSSGKVGRGKGLKERARRIVNSRLCMPWVIEGTIVGAHGAPRVRVNPRLGYRDAGELILSAGSAVGVCYRAPPAVRTESGDRAFRHGPSRANPCSPRLSISALESGCTYLHLIEPGLSTSGCDRPTDFIYEDEPLFLPYHHLPTHPPSAAHHGPVSHPQRREHGPQDHGPYRPLHQQRIRAFC